MADSLTHAYALLLTGDDKKVAMKPESTSE